jgi:tetratricopeptide (TPR) repeat protein
LNEKKILQSWKEIASYLGRAERTCRRWEKEFDLPVHRMDGSPRASVFAYTEELDQWLDRLLHEKEISSRKSFFFPAKRIVIVLSLSILFVCILTLVAWKILSPKPGVSSSSDKPSLAILYFSNNTGDEGLDHWRSTLPEWLITDLSQSKYLRVLSGDRLLNILKKLNLIEAENYDSKALENIAQEGALNHILKASFSKAGDTFRIDYSLQDVNSWESVGSDYVTGKGEESFPSMVDELTRKIKADFNISADKIAEDYYKGWGIVTTSSAEAYKLYMEARSYHRKTEYRKAIEIFEKAVALDPEFASAYRSMAITYKNMGDKYEYRKLIKKAFGLSDRISGLEKYRIQGEFYRSTEKTYDKAIEAFKTLLTHYPDLSPGNTNLAILYINLEEWDKAIAHTDVNIRNKDTSFYSYNAQVFAYMAKGSYYRAREIINYYLNNIRNNAALRQKLAYWYLIRGDYTKALNEVNHALQSSQLWHYRYCKGNIYLCKGDFESAEIEYKKLLEMEEKSAHLAGWVYLGFLEVSKGRFKEAEKNFRQSLEIAEEINQTDIEALSRFFLAYLYLKKGNIATALEDCETERSKGVQEGSYSRQIEAYFMKGLAHLQRDDVEEAEKSAKKLKLIVDQWLNKKMIRYHYLLIGLIELKKENFSASIENFRNALSQMRHQASDPSDHALFLEPLAYAYYKLNDVDKAEREFKRITSLTMGRLHWGDIYAKSFYMLGKIYEEKGWNGKAIEHYEKFLSFWKDADPGLPEVEDAKRRLMALTD